MILQEISLSYKGEGAGIIGGCTNSTMSRKPNNRVDDAIEFSVDMAKLWKFVFPLSPCHSQSEVSHPAFISFLDKYCKFLRKIQKQRFGTLKVEIIKGKNELHGNVNIVHILAYMLTQSHMQSTNWHAYAVDIIFNLWHNKCFVLPSPSLFHS